MSKPKRFPTKVGSFGGYEVALLRKGDAYGREDCLEHDRDEPIVQFRRGDYIVSSYYLTTIAENIGRGRGLMLDGGTGESIDSVALQRAYQAVQCEWALGAPEGHPLRMKR